ncbi:E3 binding domain-containing protein [Haloplanus sp.]|uniref:E3 binding domain-containing protein n=1 Tax=Haloplanus sp. TaxID=1961696 RepID=UPI0026174449|nr:E3 binding domain-containing protein [Haloplanus sp.]
MGYVVRMPKLGLEMEQGTLLEWAVDMGESVGEDDLIAEIESEKSIGEVDAREDGVLREAYLSVGDAVPPGTPIGIVAPAEADISSLEADAEADLAGDAAAETTESPGATGGADDPGDTDPAHTDADDGTTTGVKASPRARRRAEELGVDIATVEGTGPQNSVTEADVEAATEGDENRGLKDGETATRPGRADPETETVAGVTRAPPSTVDRYARETMVLDADAAESVFDAAAAARETVDEDASVTDVMVLVTTDALASSPRCNATFADATHQLRSEAHIDIVVGNEGEMSGTVRVDDASAFAAGSAVGRVINPPAVVALEFDPVGQRATPEHDGVGFEPLVTLGVTYDTRALDADDARAFLDAVAAAAGRAPALVTESFLSGA